MVEYLKLENVGPAPSMELELGSRLNLLTGDNGLGKSFLLDVIWWTLTGVWPADVNPSIAGGRPAAPLDPKVNAAIRLGKRWAEKSSESVFQFRRQGLFWMGEPPHGTFAPGLVAYILADGSHAVWDPARNDSPRLESTGIPAAFVLNPLELWNGLTQDRSSLCNGLIDDWAGWQKENSNTFRILASALEVLSPTGETPLRPGRLTRISLRDARDIPTVTMPYGEDVPLPLAASGIRKAAAFAYLLTWMWTEHLRACELQGQASAKELTFLVDELDAHLHPRWQRTILRSLLAAAGQLSPDLKVQLVCATHSPLVMASAEPHFDPETDAWFDLDLVPNGAGPPRVALTQRPLVPTGNASDWLVSEAFDLDDPGSEEREVALGRAEAAMDDGHMDLGAARELHEELLRLLPETDSFWMRWRHFGRRQGWWR